MNTTPSGTMDRPITGATRVFPIIGHPVSGVFSPPAFNDFFLRNRIDAVMIGLDITPAALPAFWDLLRGSANMVGCSITYPHKQAAFEAVDSMTGRARRLGALNTVRREETGKLVGDATDGMAMVRAMEARGVQIAGRTAHVSGAGGGAGLAIVDALAEAGIAALSLTEIALDRLSAVRALVADHWPEVEVLASPQPCEILVNATTLGKSPADPMPFEESDLSKAQAFCDVITLDQDTAFLARGRILGASLVSGNDMGAHQLQAQLSHVGLVTA
ncbi:shikimate dehydrogenase family protein [Roseibium aestuarii]|uniref:Shikimate dehydrogenase family protein n=1 Tax=Roseibium aestuarii TaxID=2600299 RepID=A0ABW4K207_9HYPH|nr:shikimate dehydrogenase [Roseibium aestuarii]